MFSGSHSKRAHAKSRPSYNSQPIKNALDRHGRPLCIKEEVVVRKKTLKVLINFGNGADLKCNGDERSGPEKSGCGKNITRRKRKTADPVTDKI